MEINRFYRFGSNLFSSTFQAHPVSLTQRKDNDTKISYTANLIRGIYRDINFPVFFQHKYGTKLHDILDTGVAGLYLISNKLKEVLENNDLSGWKTFSIKILDKKENELDGYYGLSIIGRCGPIDYKKSDIIEKQLAPNGPKVKYYKGLHPGLDQWDGSDLFLPESYFGVILSPKAAEVLKKSKLTNINLEELTAIEFSESTLINLGKIKS